MIHSGSMGRDWGALGAIRRAVAKAIAIILITLGLAPAASPRAAAAQPAGDQEPAAGPRPRIGFFAAAGPAEARAEETMLRTPTPERERAWLRALTEEPHVAGTPEDRKTAEYVRDRLVDFGLKAEMTSYDVLLNYPKSVSLRLLKPETADLALRVVSRRF